MSPADAHAMLASYIPRQLLFRTSLPGCSFACGWHCFSSGQSTNETDPAPSTQVRRAITSGSAGLDPRNRPPPSRATLSSRRRAARAGNGPQQDFINLVGAHAHEICGMLWRCRDSQRLLHSPKTTFLARTSARAPFSSYALRITVDLCARQSGKQLVAGPGRAGFVRTAIESSGSFFCWRSLCPASPTRRQRLDYVECLQPGRATLCTFAGSWTRRR